MLDWYVLAELNSCCPASHNDVVGALLSVGVVLEESECQKLLKCQMGARFWSKKLRSLGATSLTKKVATLNRNHYLHSFACAFGGHLSVRGRH